MAAPTKTLAARVARAHKNHQKHPSAMTAVEVDDSRRDLAAERLADYITKVVDQAPPLTKEQQDRLGRLLAGDTP